MNAILRDRKLEDAFARDGFVLLDDLVSGDEVARLRKVISGLMESQRRGRIPAGALGRARRVLSGLGRARRRRARSRGLLGQKSFYTHSLEARSGELIPHADPIFRRTYDRYLNVEYKNTFISCMIRVGDDSTKCHNHASNMPFPRAYPQIILHVPLQDMDKSSGPLTFVRGSHKPWENRTQTLGLESLDYSDVADQLKHRTVPVCTRTGQGILFNSYLLHGSSSHDDPDWRRFSIWPNAIPASCEGVMFTGNLDAQGNVTSLNEQEYGSTTGANKRLIDPCNHLPITKDELLAFMRTLD